jgi:hypothetical protein
MDWGTLILMVLGLCLFEVISSVDNAVINAEVLHTMKPRARRWFLLWGLIFAVLVVRGLLPWIIIWAVNPSLGFLGSFTATFSGDTSIQTSIETSAPILLMGGGVFLLFLFLNWLFLEEKHFGFPLERYIATKGFWFYSVVSILLAGIVWEALQISPLVAFSAVIGSTAFFITHGFKRNAEEVEQKMLKSSNLSDISKIIYLEIIDTTFSIDGVLGAFAFTLSVPLILLGNGLGAIVVRQITVGNIERVKHYKYLKNGAMYSIFGLGIIMILESFGWHVPSYVSPVLTFVMIGYFFWRSRKDLKKDLAKI